LTQINLKKIAINKKLNFLKSKIAVTVENYSQQSGIPYRLKRLCIDPQTQKNR